MSTQHRGIIRTWKDDKGFGFITPDGGGTDVFFHVKDVVGRRTRPTEKMVVYFNVKHDEQQRLQAVNVHLDSESLSPVIISLSIVVVLFILLGYLSVMHGIPAWMALIYAIMSGLTYALYGNDKTRAVTGKRRIAERDLHFFELLGGWPGALVAQQYFRHKNRKTSYQVVYWFMVVLNIGILALIALITGSAFSELLSSII